MATTEGFPGRSSVRAGDTLHLHLSSTSTSIPGPRTLGVDRVRPVGPVGGTPTTATFVVSVPFQSVNPPQPWEGYGWGPAYTFRIPAAWPSGLYRVHEAGQTLFDFVVRAGTPGSTSRILFQ